MSTRGNISHGELMLMLSLMRLGKNAYGVSISREIEETTGREVALASVYAGLARLEAKELVTSRLGEPTPERGGRAKRYFHVTAKGLRVVREAQRALTKLWQGQPQLKGEVT